ncbi:hypothetical protein [Promicromonospora sp. NPDC023987]|uniref:hypothetical protein n=1 Tax=Promicromonospora sp. NPDC023987 TaxID=3155360 RepID=UPI0033DA63FB
MSHETPDNDNDFLRGALHGAADKMPGTEVDDLHVSFGVVRDRVRRRRAAKIGGVTGASLVLVGVLAFGATQTPLLDSEPVLPGAPTEEPSSSGQPATSVIQDGYQPTWLDWSELTCGMPVSDLTTTAPGWSAAPAGDIYAMTSDFGGGDPSTAWGMAATVQAGDGTFNVPPVLVWSQGDVVVDLGANVFGAPVQAEPLLGGGDGAVEAQSNAATTCAPTETETVDLFETALPPGDYEVRVVAFPAVASGQWATAVSEPVSVRLDADGAHSPTGTRGGDATIEPPAVDQAEQSRFVLDRSTDWVTAGVTYEGYASTDPVSVTAQCESSNPEDTVPFEVVRPSNQQVLGAGEVSCDGSQDVTDLEVLDGAEEALDIRLGTVPDGVARLWAVLAPTTVAGGGGNDRGNDGSNDGSGSGSNGGSGAGSGSGDGGGGGSGDGDSSGGGSGSGDGDGDGVGDPAADCSAAGMTMAYDPASSPSAAAGTTAATIVEAARACDSERLIQLATQHGTQLMFSTETPEQVFGLPEADTLPYGTVVRLLAGTVGVVNGGDPGNETITWPRVSTQEFADSDEAWAEVVSAGLLTQAEADAQRADETFGYTGMVIGIDKSGTWRYYEPSNA